MNSDENERLTCVSSGTPMGAFLRRFWWPACLSSELPDPDGAPVRVRLLGEDLVAFRDSGGAVGLVEAHCPHRRAPLFFGRNEAFGLRCAYHGWKFDRFGTCVDMPSEPPATALQARVTLCAYITFESGGLIWAYLGPKALEPGKPDFEWTRIPSTHRFVSKTFEDCNWLQALEGGLDPVHSSFLHSTKAPPGRSLRERNRQPSIEIEPTGYGYRYISVRDMGAEGNYVRVSHYIMPAHQMRANNISRFGGRNQLPRFNGHIWVPVDDHNTCVYNWVCSHDHRVALTADWLERIEKGAGRGSDDLIPGTFRLKRNQANDYLIDRDMQKRHNYTGIAGVNTQDFAVQEGMGAICDRAKEFLTGSDRVIVAMRRLLLKALEAMEAGETPPGSDVSLCRNIRPYDGMAPPGSDWRRCFEKELVAKW